MPPSEAATPSLSGVPTSRDHCGPPSRTQPAIGQSKPSAAPAGARHPPESRSWHARSAQPCAIERRRMGRL